MSGSPEPSSYAFGDTEEYCLTAGRECDQAILIIPPLFDEMNRVRKALVDVMRLLSGSGLGSVMPDLPGTNESLITAEKTSFAMWEDALSSCTKQNPNIVATAAFRGGCLVDNFSSDLKTWRLSPVKGTKLLRALMRTRIASDKEAGQVTSMKNLTEQAAHSSVNLAGNVISPRLFADLQGAEPHECADRRTAYLETENRQADVQLPGSALWLRAEPDCDAILSRAIAEDLARWLRS